MTLYWVDDHNKRVDYMTFSGSLRSVRKQAKKLARNKLFHTINPTAIRIDICEDGLFGEELERVAIVK